MFIAYHTEMHAFVSPAN